MKTRSIFVYCFSFPLFSKEQRRAVTLCQQQGHIVCSRGTKGDSPFIPYSLAELFLAFALHHYEKGKDGIAHLVPWSSSLRHLMTIIIILYLCLSFKKACTQGVSFSSIRANPLFSFSYYYLPTFLCFCLSLFCLENFQFLRQKRGDKNREFIAYPNVDYAHTHPPTQRQESFLLCYILD